MPLTDEERESIKRKTLADLRYYSKSISTEVPKNDTDNTDYVGFIGLLLIIVLSIFVSPWFAITLLGLLCGPIGWIFLALAFFLS